MGMIRRVNDVVVIDRRVNDVGITEQHLGRVLWLRIEARAETELIMLGDGGGGSTAEVI